MRLLVPLPFDISNAAHGRNLRIAHLLPAIQDECEVLCVAADERTAAAAREAMPTVPVQIAGSPGRSGGGDRIIRNESYAVRRSLSFLGYNAALADVVNRLATSADVVTGFDMPSVAYLLAAAACDGGPRPRLVCDLIDDPWLLRKSASLGYRWSAAGLKAAAAMQVVRHRVLPRFDALIVVAPGDADSLARVTGRPTAVVPNGVDIDREACDRWPREPLVVFTGNMGFPANQEAACFLARQVWPLVLASCSCGLGRTGTADTGRDLPRLAIVGAHPAPAVQQLADLPHVVVTGRVPSIREWLRRAQVAVAPMLGGTGLKNKILEACATGCPVVATPAAIGGLPSGEEVGIIRADGPERIAAEIVRLLADGATARRIGRAGLDMVRTRFGWPHAAAGFLRVLRANSDRPSHSDSPPTDGGRSAHPAAHQPHTAADKEAPAHAAP